MSSRTPVPRRDYGLVDVTGRGYLELQLPGLMPKQLDDDDDNADMADDSRLNLQGHDRPIYLHELYPIIPAVAIREIDGSIWKRDANADDTWLGVWQTAWCDRYRPLFSSADEALHSLRTTVEPLIDGLGLFGREIYAVVDMCRTLKDTSMIMHYMMMTTLQYYLSARNRWMCVRTSNPDFIPDDLYPTFTFMLFRGADWGVNETKLQDIHLSASNLVHAAQTLSLPLLLRAVMMHQLHYAPGFEGLYEADEVDKFCLEKLKKNFAQAMVCTRFREIVPTNLLTVVNAHLKPSQHLKVKPVKFYPHPNHIKMLSLHCKENEVIERVPQMFCHMVFSPITRVLTVAEGGEPLIHTAWKLLMYLPLTDFEKKLQSKIQHRPFLPTTLVDKERMYDPVLPDISHARLRYCIYVCKETVYAFLPWIHYNTPKSEDANSPALRSWSALTEQPPPQGPILFGNEPAVLKPANPLVLLEQQTSALRQQMMKVDLLKEVHTWLQTKPTTVSEKQKASLDMLLQMCSDDGLSHAVHERLSACQVVKAE